MSTDLDPYRKNPDEAKSKSKGLLIALIALGVLAAVTWAVAVLFEMALAKALAVVILILFFFALAAVLMGIAPF